MPVALWLTGAQGQREPNGKISINSANFYLALGAKRPPGTP